MSISIDVEIGSLLLAVILALSGGMVWAIKWLLKAGVWFSTVAANTSAVAKLSEQMEEIKQLMTEIRTELKDISRRVDRLENDKR